MLVTRNCHKSLGREKNLQYSIDEQKKLLKINHRLITSEAALSACREMIRNHNIDRDLLRKPANMTATREQTLIVTSQFNLHRATQMPKRAEL